jgi:hypothetical protein
MPAIRGRDALDTFDAIGCEGLAQELLLERLCLGPEAAYNAVLINRHLNRHTSDLHHVDRIVQDGPIQPLPLCEQPRALAMLLLCDCEHNEPALSDVLLHLCIPGRHGLAAAPSPGGKMDE